MKLSLDELALFLLMRADKFKRILNNTDVGNVWQSIQKVKDIVDEIISRRPIIKKGD